MTDQQDEPNAVDEATARAIAAQGRRITELRFKVDGAKKDVQQLVDDLHAAREREEHLRADLLVEETQLWRLRHPAKDVVVGVDVHDLTEVLDEHAHRALQGGAR